MRATVLSEARRVSGAQTAEMLAASSNAALLQLNILQTVDFPTTKH
jgi:hypothetical protein